MSNGISTASMFGILSSKNVSFLQVNSQNKHATLLLKSLFINISYIWYKCNKRIFNSLKMQGDLLASSIISQVLLALEILDYNDKSLIIGQFF